MTSSVSLWEHLNDTLHQKLLNPSHIIHNPKHVGKLKPTNTTSARLTHTHTHTTSALPDRSRICPNMERSGRLERAEIRIKVTFLQRSQSSYKTTQTDHINDDNPFTSYTLYTSKTTAHIWRRNVRTGPEACCLMLRVTPSPWHTGERHAGIRVCVGGAVNTVSGWQPARAHTHPAGKGVCVCVLEFGWGCFKCCSVKFKEVKSSRLLNTQLSLLSITRQTHVIMFIYRTFSNINDLQCVHELICLQA